MLLVTNIMSALRTDSVKTFPYLRRLLLSTWAGAMHFHYDTCGGQTCTALRVVRVRWHPHLHNRRIIEALPPTRCSNSAVANQSALVPAWNKSRRPPQWWSRSWDFNEHIPPEFVWILYILYRPISDCLAGSSAEEISGGDLEDMEENSNPSSSHISNSKHPGWISGI